MTQLVKNPSAMRETWVPSLGWEDPLEKGKATHSSVLAWRSPWGHKELDMTERLSLLLYTCKERVLISCQAQQMCPLVKFLDSIAQRSSTILLTLVYLFYQLQREMLKLAKSAFF